VVKRCGQGWRECWDGRAQAGVSPGGQRGRRRRDDAAFIFGDEVWAHHGRHADHALDLLVAEAARPQRGAQGVRGDRLGADRAAERRGEDLGHLDEGEIFGAMDGLDVTAGPAAVKQPGCGDVADVTRVDPRLRVVDGGRYADQAVTQGVEIEVGVEVTAAQVKDRGSGGVEDFLGAGQAGDLPDAGALLRADAADEYGAGNAVLGYGAGRGGAELGVPGHRVGVGVCHERREPEQGVSAASRPDNGVGVGQVRPDDVGPFEHTRVQPRGMASQKRGPGARLQKHLDDP
jgi:hypothetical protein